jgi:hypothetical protein
MLKEGRLRTNPPSPSPPYSLFSLEGKPISKVKMENKARKKVKK